MWGHRSPEAEAGARERFRPLSLLGFPWKVTTLGLANLHNFYGLWAIGVIPSYLASGPGMIKAEEYCLLGCLGQMKKVWFWISCLHIKGMLPVESSAISKNWLAPGGEGKSSPKARKVFFFF